MFTPLNEPLLVILTQLDTAHMVTYPMTQPFDDNAPKPSWYKEHEYCEMHHVKGHKKKMFGLCHYIQELIENGEIEVDNPGKNHTPNENMEIYKEPFPKHGKSEESQTDWGESSQSYKATNYLYTKKDNNHYDSRMGCIRSPNDHINTI